MKIRVSGVAFSLAITWALIVFSVGLINFFFSGYGIKFLSLMESIYPGYALGKWGFLGVLVATGYGFVCAFIMGFILGGIYNIFAKK